MFNGKDLTGWKPIPAQNWRVENGELVADIFLGKVTRWNDPRIAALNGGIALPDMKITVVHRSDGSGTTFNSVNYLSKVSPEWKAKVGEGTSVN